MRPSPGQIVLAGVFLAIGFFLGTLYGGYTAGILSFTQFFLGLVGLGGLVGFMEAVNRYFSVPSLEYGKRPLRNDQGTYFLRIWKKHGSGRARDCEALLTIFGTSRGEVATPWEHLNAPRLRDISRYADLYLFSIDKNYDESMRQPEQSIVFYSARSEGGYEANRVNYDEYTKRLLRVTLEPNFGRKPKEPYSKRISDIISEAIPQFAE